MVALTAASERIAALARAVLILEYPLPVPCPLFGATLDLVTATQDFTSPDLSDLGDVPLDAPLPISDEEYALIMRRIGIAEGESGTSVSAFNSSI